MRALALVLLVACSAPPAPQPDGKLTVSGEVVDTSGAPWANAKVQVCSAALCTLGNADSSGAFAVQVPAGNRYHVIAHPPPDDAREGSAGLGVLADALVADTALDSPMYIPVTGAHASSPAAVTSDLTLTADPADLSFSGEAYFSGVSVEPSQWPAFAAGQTILAMWALNPWGTRANPGKAIAVTIANTYGLSPGDTVSVYAVNETTAELGAPTQGTVSTDGQTITGATIDRVTWIILAH